MKRDANGNIETWICPRCGKETNDYPALSRRDNKTNICSQCGTDEALLDWGKHLIEQSKKEQE
jgi:transcription elongation factor Elf1